MAVAGLLTCTSVKTLAIHPHESYDRIDNELLEGLLMILEGRSMEHLSRIVVDSYLYDEVKGLSKGREFLDALKLRGILYERIVDSEWYQ